MTKWKMKFELADPGFKWWSGQPPDPGIPGDIPYLGYFCVRVAMKTKNENP